MKWIVFITVNLRVPKAISYELKSDNIARSNSFMDLSLKINNHYKVHLTNIPLLEKSVYSENIEITNETILISNSGMEHFL